MTSLAQISSNTANTRKYSFYTKQAVLLTDDDHFHFNCICETYESQLQPKTTVQHTLFNQIVLVAWNIQRSNYVETQLALTEGIDPLLSPSKIIGRIHAFRNRSERSLLKLLTEFRRTKSELKNEPKSPPRRTQNYLVSSTYKSEPYLRPEAKVGRNEPCPCKSGRKFKQCCLQNEPNSIPESSPQHV